MDTDKIKMFGSYVHVDSLTKLVEIEQSENLKVKRKVGKIRIMEVIYLSIVNWFALAIAQDCAEDDGGFDAA